MVANVRLSAALFTHPNIVPRISKVDFQRSLKLLTTIQSKSFIILQCNVHLSSWIGEAWLLFSLKFWLMKILLKLSEILFAVKCFIISLYGGGTNYFQVVSDIRSLRQKQDKMWIFLLFEKCPQDDIIFNFASSYLSWRLELEAWKHQHF